MEYEDVKLPDIDNKGDVSRISSEKNKDRNLNDAKQEWRQVENDAKLLANWIALLK